MSGKWICSFVRCFGLALAVHGGIVYSQESAVPSLNSPLVNEVVDKGEIVRVGEDLAEFDGASEHEVGAKVQDPRIGMKLLGGQLQWVASSEIRYDDNILFALLGQRSDLVSNLAAGFDWGFPRSIEGESTPSTIFQTSYRGGYEMFSDLSSQNNVFQNASLGVARVFPRGRLDLSYGFDTGTTPILQEGGRVRRTTHIPSFLTTFELGRKLESSLSFQYLDTSVQDQIDTLRISGEGYVDYRVASKTLVGTGFVVGSDQTSIGFNSFYEQFRFRADYSASERISVNLYGGGEFRQFDGNVPEEFGPIFGLALGYKVSRATRIDLSAERALRPSNFLPGQIRRDTSVTLGLEQRFLRRYFVTVSGTLGQASFAQSTVGALPLGDQTYSIVDVQAKRNFGGRFDVALFYRWTGRGQNQLGNALENNQTGIRLAYQF